MVLRWYSIGVAMAILVVAGCNGERGRFEEETSTAEEPMTVPPAAEVPAPAGTRALPEVLERAEEAAEDVQEEIREADWDDAAKKTNELRALSDSIRQTGAPATELSAYDSAVTALAQHVQSRDQINAGLAANAASRAVISMMSAYDVKVPVEVGYMDVDTRNVVYYAAANRWTEAETSVKDLQSNYSKVQAHVAQRDSNLDSTVRTGIEQLGTAVTQKNSQAVKEAADRVLDKIDDLEKTY